MTLPGRGTIYTYTVIRVPPARLSGRAPYTVIVVELAEGLRVTARLEPDQPVEIGQEVEFVRETEDGYWFRPVEGEKERPGGSR